MLAEIQSILKYVSKYFHSLRQLSSHVSGLNGSFAESLQVVGWRCLPRKVYCLYMWLWLFAHCTMCRWFPMDWEVTTSRTTTILAQWQILSLPTQRCLFSTLVVFQGGIQIIKMEISDVFFHEGGGVSSSTYLF